MNTFSKLTLVVSAALLAAACGGANLTIDVVAQNNSNETGTVKLFDKGSDTEVLIETAGSIDINPQPVYLKSGGCSPVGAQSGDVIDTLNNVVNGTSDSTVSGRKVTDLTGGKYHIEIVNSGNPGLLNSCASIP